MTAKRKVLCRVKISNSWSSFVVTECQCIRNLCAFNEHKHNLGFVLEVTSIQLIISLEPEDIERWDWSH